MSADFIWLRSRFSFRRVAVNIADRVLGVGVALGQKRPSSPKK
jgi:hypothetical protein